MSADHDPLCLAVTKGGFWPNSDDPATAGCWVCDLIARVRADERQQARQQVEVLDGFYAGQTNDWANGWHEALKAVRNVAAGGDA